MYYNENPCTSKDQYGFSKWSENPWHCSQLKWQNIQPIRFVAKQNIKKMMMTLNNRNIQLNIQKINNENIITLQNKLP